MALTNNTTNEYLKISSIQFDFYYNNHHIAYYIFKDKTHRENYSKGLTNDEPKYGIYNGFGNIDLEISKTNELTNAKDSIYNACYLALKADNFADWIDS